MDALQTIKYPTGETLRIYPDESPENPRRWDNLCTMVCFHGRYELGDKDKHEYRSADFNGWDELKAQIEKDHDPAVILPLYLFDHSGITISTSPFSCPWDSGQVGFIFVSKERVRKEYNCHRIGKRILEKVQRVVKCEVEQYDQYLIGDVYGYILKDANGEHLDSCWGFYGNNHRENGMVDQLEPQFAKLLGVL